MDLRLKKSTSSCLCHNSNSNLDSHGKQACIDKNISYTSFRSQRYYFLLFMVSVRVLHVLHNHTLPMIWLVIFNVHVLRFKSEFFNRTSSLVALNHVTLIRTPKNSATMCAFHLSQQCLLISILFHTPDQAVERNNPLIASLYNYTPRRNAHKHQRHSAVSATEAQQIKHWQRINKKMVEGGVQWLTMLIPDPAFSVQRHTQPLQPSQRWPAHSQCLSVCPHTNAHKHTLQECKGN